MLVIFHDHGDHVLSRFLKKGFRHVFCCIDDGRFWILIDGKAGLPEITVLQTNDYDMKAFYENEGFAVLEVEGGEPLKTPMVLSNCVGLVKAVLGLRCSAITPYQLYKRLK